MQRTQQRPPLTAPDHEELFIKRYERLLGWALRLTGGSRPAAEDLVHDVYVQFMLGGCDLKSIHNLDGYLRRSLLNLFLAQQRQATKMQNVSINVINYESIEIGLLAIDSQTRWQVQEALLQVCQYACRRKESSRAGSVLILRFFYDYTPGEIARVIGSPRRAVDDWLRIARREARLHLEDPTRLKFMSGRPAGRLTTILAESPDSLIREIRATIAWSRQGPCLSPERLRELYGGPEASPLDCATLSHLVSCPGCLDRANHWLGLPPLADRYSGGRPGPGDEGPGAGGTDAQPGGAASAGGAAPPEAPIKTLRRRLQQVIEHRPEELQLASNGSPIGRLKLTSELSEFQLHLRDQAPIEFIEVFSERNVRLLLFSIEPDGSAPEQQTRIELSDGRSLEAIFKNEAPWPSLRIIYHDPLLAAAAADCPSISDPPDLRSPWRRRFGRVKRRRESPSILAVPKTRFRLRPGLVAAALSIMLVAGLLYLQSRSTRVTAAGLLHRARAAEESIAPGLSVLRTLDLEERSLPDGRIVMRRRIRIRQDGKSGLRVRRLYDEQQHLIAGEWITNLAAAASRTIYRRGQSPRTEPATRDPQAALRDRELWRLEPSARLYEELIGRPDLARATELPETYVINFEQPETDPASARLLKATLTLRKTDLHAVEQTLLVRIIDEGQPQWREFRFSESGFERQQPSTVAPEEFKPEPELLGAGEHGGRAANSIATPSTLVVSASAPSASPELEVEVLSLLHRVNADLNEPVTITRAADGALRIEALTETAERKAEILAALQPVINHPAVRVEVETVAEAMRKRRPEAAPAAGRVLDQRMAPASNALPVDQELRRYLARAEDRARFGSEIESALQRFALQVLNRASATANHARALERLARRFSPDQSQALTPSVREKWRALVFTHAQTVGQETAVLRRLLQPVFFATAAPEPEGKPLAAVTDDASLATAVRQLSELSAAVEKAINEAFTLSNEKAAATAVREPQFLSTLEQIERSAAIIQNYSRSEDSNREIRGIR